uniref:Amidohydrolase 2 n=1 Tax=Solibacter usitatus (strain Ellin6076) TaxID=234267 RepID=Q028P9_SOLUE
MSFSRIDSHQHFTREYLPTLLFPILKRNRFEGSVVVCEQAGVEENRWLLGLAAEHEFIRGVVCGVDLGDAALPALLDEYQEHAKFRGVYADGGSAAEIARRGLTLDVPPRFGEAARLAAAHPLLRIAIDHVGRPSLMSEGVNELTALARFPNVCVKLSGLITDAPTQWKAAEFAPWARAALAAFGAERVMFGSDWPSYLPVGTWKEALAAFTQAIGAQDLETREQLLGATADRFYRLGDGA